MDPNILFDAVREALKTGDLEGARGHFRALDLWIKSGGSLPEKWEANRKCERCEEIKRIVSAW